MRVVVAVQGQADLLEIVLALGASRRLTHQHGLQGKRAIRMAMIAITTA